MDIHQMLGLQIRFIPYLPEVDILSTTLEIQLRIPHMDTILKRDGNMILVLVYHLQWVPVCVSSKVSDITRTKPGRRKERLYEHSEINN